MADGPVAMVGGRLCVLPGAGQAPVPVDTLALGTVPLGRAVPTGPGTIPGLPPDIIERLRKWFPLHTYLRTSNPPVGADSLASPLWTAEPLRVGAVLSLKNAPGDVYLSERTDITIKGYDAPAGALFVFGQECPDEMFAYSSTGAFDASVMEILRRGTEG